MGMEIYERSLKRLKDARRISVSGVSLFLDLILPKEASDDMRRYDTEIPTLRKKFIQQNFFGCPDKIFCCPNKTFCLSNKILLI